MNRPKLLPDGRLEYLPNHNLIILFKSNGQYPVTDKLTRRPTHLIFAPSGITLIWCEEFHTYRTLLEGEFAPYLEQLKEKGYGPEQK